MFKKGDRVIVRPVSYPGQRYEGVIERKLPRGLGFRVKVDVAGMKFSESYSPNEVMEKLQ